MPRSRRNMLHEVPEKHIFPPPKNAQQNPSW